MKFKDVKYELLDSKSFFILKFYHLNAIFAFMV